MPRLSFFLLLLGSLLAVLLSAAPSLATPQVAVEVQPAEVSLAPGGSSEVTVVARNSSGQTIRSVNLEPYSDIHVSATPQENEPQDLAPDGVRAWVVDLKAEPDFVPGKLQFRVSFTQTITTSQILQEFPGVAFASLSVNLRQLPAVSDVAELEVQSTLQTLDDQHKGLLYLLVHNKSTMPIQLTRLAVAPTPKDLVVSLGNMDTQTPIKPGNTRIITTTVSTSSQINPGKYLILFDAAFAWDSAGSHQTGSLSASREVSIGVFGESAILQVLILPSFLLVPGAIMMLTIQALWSIGKTADQKKEYELKAPNALFWLGVVTGSLLMAKFLYPLFTSWILSSSRSYLPGYGFDDIVYAWFFSLVVGATGYGLYGLALKTRLLAVRAGQSLHTRWDNYFTPNSEDEPLDALRKLKRQNWTKLALGGKVSGKLQRVTFNDGEDKQQAGFLLQPLKEGRKTIWIGPRITVKEKPAPAAGETPPATNMADDGDWQTQIDAAQGDSGSLTALVDTLQKWEPRLEIKWQPIEELTRPRLIDTKGIVPAGEQSVVFPDFGG